MITEFDSKIKKFYIWNYNFNLKVNDLFFKYTDNLAGPGF